MFITKKRYNKEISELNSFYEKINEEEKEELRFQFETEKQEILKSHSIELDKLEKQLNECQNALKIKEMRFETEKHQYVEDNILKQMLERLKEYKFNCENLKFCYTKNKKNKFEVATSYCQLCGGESEIHVFDTETEAWLFCVVKTLNGDKIGSTCHSSCYREYMEEFVL